jgi:hypothetical protein
MLFVIFIFYLYIITFIITGTLLMQDVNRALIHPFGDNFYRTNCQYFCKLTYNHV